MEINEAEKCVIEHKHGRNRYKWSRQGDRVFAQHLEGFWLWASLTYIVLLRFKGRDSHDWKSGESKSITSFWYAQAFHRATGGRQDNSFGAVRYDGRGHTILSWTRYTLCQGIHECSLLFCQHCELNKWLINFKLMDERIFLCSQKKRTDTKMKKRERPCILQNPLKLRVYEAVWY